MNVRAVILAAVLVAAAIGRAELAAIEPAAASSLRLLPLRLDGWLGREGRPLDQAVLDILRADDHINRVYVDDAGLAGLFVAYFRSQQFGATIHSPMNCLPGSGWDPIHTELVPHGEHGTMKRVLVQRGQDQLLVLYWYQTPGRVEGSEYWSKFHLVKDAFTSRRNDAALVRVVAPVDRARANGVAEAASTAARLARATQPAVASLLFK